MSSGPRSGRLAVWHLPSAPAKEQCTAYILTVLSERLTAVSEVALVWLKAVASGSGACVEVASVPGGEVAMRDSKNPAGGMIVLSRAAFAGWVDGAKRGEFDHLIG